MRPAIPRFPAAASTVALAALACCLHLAVTAPISAQEFGVAVDLSTGERFFYPCEEKAVILEMPNVVTGEAVLADGVSNGQDDDCDGLVDADDTEFCNPNLLTGGPRACDRFDGDDPVTVQACNVSSVRVRGLRTNCFSEAGDCQPDAGACGDPRALAPGANCWCQCTRGLGGTPVQKCSSPRVRCPFDCRPCAANACIGICGSVTSVAVAHCFDGC